MPVAFEVIVPARYGSTRLPGKPLLEIAGQPMIRHVVERCRASAAARVTVATDDERIRDAVTAFGGSAVMTSPAHRSGTDRVAEAADRLGLDDDTCIVNVQGDEPDMPPALIDQVACALAADRQASVATACAPVADPAEVEDPSVVKVVCNRDRHALYFSRAAIPRAATTAGVHAVRRHLGIYAYRAGYVRRFAALPRCELEELESLEQLRCLWHGDVVHCVEAVAAPGPGIDTPADLERMRGVSG